MKNLLILLILGVASYGGYTKWKNHREAANPSKVAEAKEEIVPAPKVEPTPAPTPEPRKVEPEQQKVKPEPPMPVVPAKRLAPEGVFYAVQAFSVMTDDGIRGIRAGTPLKLIKDTGAILRVTDGKEEFEAKREHLTNDLDLAAQASGQQVSQQAANAEWHEKQKALAAMTEQEKAANLAVTQQRVEELNQSAQAAAAQRTQRIAEIRAEITSAEQYKSVIPRPQFITKQKHINIQNEKIRLLQNELFRLGVGGAPFEPR